MASDCSVLIVGAAVLLMPDSATLSDYADVINSVLFAQLSANKQVAKDSSLDWYDAYSQVLDSFWLRSVKTREDFDLKPDSATSASTLIVGAMAEIEKDLATLTAEAMFRVVNASDSNRAINVLRTHMHKPGHASVERSPEAAENAHMLVIVARTPDSLSSVYISYQNCPPLNSHPRVSPDLGAELQGLITLRCAQANLSEALYCLARGGIAVKLKDRIAANVVLFTECDEPCAVDLSR